VQRHKVRRGRATLVTHSRARSYTRHVLFGGGGERESSARIIACPYALLLHSLTPARSRNHLSYTGTPLQTGATASCHARVINFHAPAGRCVAFVRIYGITRPSAGRRDSRDAARVSWPTGPAGSRERLIFQGNTWRDISACISVTSAARRS